MLVLLFNRTDWGVEPPVEVPSDQPGRAPMGGGGPGVQIGLSEFLAEQRRRNRPPEPAIQDDDEEAVLALLMALAA